MKSAAMLKKLEDCAAKLGERAFLTFSRKAKASVAAARELEAAGKVTVCDWPNNEIRVSLKK